MITNLLFVITALTVVFTFFFLCTFTAIHIVRPIINRKILRAVVIAAFLTLEIALLLIIKTGLDQAFLFSALVTSFFASLFVLRIILNSTYSQIVGLVLIVTIIGWGLYVSIDKLSDLSLNLF